MYQCRPVLAEDYSLICSFPQNAEELFYMFPTAAYPLTVDQIERNSNSRLKPTVILNHSGQVTGYSNLYNYEEAERCWLGNVILSPKYRGTGLAEFLINNMIAIARNELEVKTLHLCCHSTNTRGLLFYSKLGFKPYDLTKITGNQGELIAGILMRISLND